jgi:hypothetical protein
MAMPVQYWKDQMALQSMTTSPQVIPAGQPILGQSVMLQTGPAMIPQVPTQAYQMPQIVVLDYQQPVTSSPVALPQSTPTVAVQNALPPAAVDAAAATAAAAAPASKVPLLAALAAVGAAIFMNK